MTETIQGVSQSLLPGAYIQLFELDLSSIPLAPVEPYCFYAGQPGLVNSMITFNAVDYAPWPITADGFQTSGRGQLPRPRMKVANVLGSITTLVLQFNDILGAKVTKISTLGRYLDAINFPGNVNPEADPTAEFPREVYYVERKVTEQKDVVEFELATAIDVWGVQLPRRQIIQNSCTFRYKGPDCGWVPMGVFFKKDDTPTSNPAEDICSKRVSGCKCRFGDTNPLNFGGYPAAGLLRA